MMVGQKPNLKKKKMNRYQKVSHSRERMKEVLAGSGEFEYRNNTPGDLMLPKAAKDGRRQVPKGGTFVGDNYFMEMVKSHDLRLVREITATKDERKIPMNEEKLILDQPDRVTNEGKVEQVMKKPQGAQKLNEVQPQENKPDADVLLNDSPIDGVEICA